MGKEQVVLFEDDFSSYLPGELLDSEYFRKLGREEEECDKRPTAVARENRLGPWEQTTLHYAWRSKRMPSYRQCCLPWRMVDREGKHWLEQPEHFFNVVLKTGDPQWRDYEMECRIAVCDGPAGPVVRYHTSRQNYWICFESGEPVRIIRRDKNDHIVLAHMEGCVVERDTVYSCRVTCKGHRITVSTEAGTVSVEDDAYGKGQIALRTEGPCRFTGIRVTAPKEEAVLGEKRKKFETVHIAARKSSFPAAKLIHSVTIPEQASTVRIQDVNDDGRPEFIVSELSVSELDYIRLARVSVLDWQGNTLWQTGEPEDSKYAVHGAFAFNVADVDGDGRTEILMTRDFQILVIDGATGEVKSSAPTPHTFLGKEDHYEQMVGDSFLVCNLRGLESAQDFILKDRYHNMWAYTSDLKPLWHRHLNTGHYPRAYDINGDGKDEVMAGYSMLAPDGSTIWTVKGGDPLYNRFPGPEHMDSVLIAPFGGAENSPLEIAMAASDLGFLLMDTEGNIKAQHYVGHAQSLSAGRFRPDLPGRQFVVRTAWGNQGIISLFGRDGRLILTRELSESHVFPVNWTGDGRTLLRFARGLADGNFQYVVDLPPRGSVTPCSWDVNNDGVDEVFVRKGGTLEIYGPETVPSEPEPLWAQTLTNWNAYGGFMR